MALSQFVNRPDRRGGSKAQMCLHKILHLISSLRPPQSPTHESSFNPRFLNFGVQTEGNEALLRRKRGFDIDLNLDLCAGSGSEAQRNDLEADSASTSMSEKGLVAELDRKEDSELVVDDEARDFSGDQNPPGPNSEIDQNVNVSEGNNKSRIDPPRGLGVGGEDCLTMLIDAAKLISGSERHNPTPTHVLTQRELAEPKSAETRQTKRSHWWRSEEYDGESPVVRTKRGRSQVLPHRFRDSVLEPLARLSTRRRSR